jgi:hypothetical protein
VHQAVLCCFIRVQRYTLCTSHGKSSPGAGRSRLAARHTRCQSPLPEWRQGSLSAPGLIGSMRLSSWAATDVRPNVHSGHATPSIALLRSGQMDATCTAATCSLRDITPLHRTHQDKCRTLAAEPRPVDPRQRLQSPYRTGIRPLVQR